MSKPTVKLTQSAGGVRCAAVSDVGMRRTSNQDSLAISLAQDEKHLRCRGHLFIVADGMGAHAAGELASQLATDNIPHAYLKRRDWCGTGSWLVVITNALANGQHFVGGRRVDLANIRCPVLTVVTDRDVICPPPAAQALNDLSSACEKGLLVIPGGHVGAVVGATASRELYPKLAEWFSRVLAAPRTQN